MDDSVPSDFGGKATRTTWDGLPVSPDPPYGCSVVVFQGHGSDLQLLMLHRRHNGADYEGDWAWTSPSGARMPGEAVDACAARELAEETGMALPLHRTDCGGEDWCVYWAEAPHDAVIVADSEHDRYEWLAPDEALRRCAPERVRNDLERVIALLREGAGD
jgi:8-oxo-dGTP pyrophosphatase MutT (NUDIX family)